uniref:Uncharacterized protein n=1 Tax=Anguilla anguilla TaxID=7936 RepID=A0A0E9W248_ANGAN
MWALGQPYVHAPPLF